MKLKKTASHTKSTPTILANDADTDTPIKNSMMYDLYTSFLKDNWKSYICYLITLISLPLQSIAMPHYYGEIINSLKDNNIPKSKYLFAVLLGIWILIQGFSIGISFVDNYIWPKFHAYIRQFFFDLIVNRYNQNYQELKIGSILTKLIKLPWIIDDISNQIQRFLLSNSILIISNFIYLYRNHYTLGFMYIGCIAVVFIMSRLYFNTCNSNIKRVEGLYDNCHEEIEDTLQNLLSIYTSKRIPEEKDRIRAINEETRQEQFKAGICNRKFRIYFSFVNIFLFLALNYLSFRLYSNGSIKVENLVKIFILNYTILGSLMVLFNDAREFMTVKSHVELIQKFIDELPPSTDDNELKKIPNSEKLDIRFVDVIYQPATSDIKILDNFNLRIYPGQKIAIVGHSGSGKTTIVNLITRMKQFQGGDIFINGISMKNIDIDDLREHIVYIPQHPKLFNRTLEENLTYGLPKEITAEHIFNFMKENGFVDLEKIFRKRLKDKVGKTGEAFSGGQRSIIWFLRAIMKKSSLVICDEPTNNLDGDSIKYVSKMIDVLGKMRAIIIITHNMDMSQGMDRIITMDKGKIISDKLNNNNNNKNNSD
uniref:ABC transporter domain-containing protein n=1 Tax=viral metagenome TaxID=1070528 RepID=A0A6C0HL80_9ZZZZ